MIRHSFPYDLSKIGEHRALFGEELRTLVRYAADRGVRVIPELDMPGHVTSWLTAYPEWGSESPHQACALGSTKHA